MIVSVLVLIGQKGGGQGSGSSDNRDNVLSLRGSGEVEVRGLRYDLMGPSTGT